MKKTLYIAAAVIAVMFAASCQKDDVQAVKKGMTLSANVEETKAIIEKDGSVWHFSWGTGDVVSVTDPYGTSYDFTYDGTSFKCETAVPAEGEWTAVYPKGGEPESYANQDGTIASAMAKYYMTSSCTSDGSAKLSMKMNPHAAILKVKYDPIMPFPGDAEVYFQKAEDASATLLGNISDGETGYFVVPAADNITFTFDVEFMSGATETIKKNISAGKVYTRTYYGAGF